MDSKTLALCRVSQFAAGGAGYGLLEIIWRGKTHASMLIAGGICLLTLIRISGSTLPFWKKCVAGAAAITAVELAFGCVVNLWLGLDVWDYSSRKFHLLGQVCAAYSLLWLGLCALALPVCSFFHAQSALDRLSSLVAKHFRKQSS